jgi:hypothetical protein
MMTMSTTFVCVFMTMLMIVLMAVLLPLLVIVGVLMRRCRDVVMALSWRGTSSSPVLPENKDYLLS